MGEGDGKNGGASTTAPIDAAVSGGAPDVNTVQKTTPGVPAQAEIERVLGSRAIAYEMHSGSLVVTVAPADLGTVLADLKKDPALAFSMLIDITAVDWMDQRDVRFDIVYQLLSLEFKYRLTVMAAVSEDKPEVASSVPLWQGANFMEREVWDMYGIRFSGHPDLRRILMYEEFVGHPLRKDYPVQAKQPRIPLRKPEVENTARRMHRPDLVAIRPRRERNELHDPGSGSGEMRLDPRSGR